MRAFRWLCVFVGFVLIGVCPRLVSAETLSLNAQTLWEKAVTRHVQLSAEGSSLELSNGELFEDDGPAAGYSYHPNLERLSEKNWIKKTLIIPNPQTRKATLLVGGKGRFQIAVNGQSQHITPTGTVGNYWQSFALPPNVLKAGKNEFVISGSGSVWIARDDEFAFGSRTRTHHPNRSAKSSDAGQTWNDQKLGTANDVDGEYYVRVFLDHHQTRGSLLLPVLDFGNLKGDLIAPAIRSLGPIRIRAKWAAGKDGQVVIKTRFGSRPVFDAGTWSNWQELPKIQIAGNPLQGRYLQVQIELNTRDPLHTPKLQQLVIESNTKPTSEWTKTLTVLENQNQSITRSAVPFEYEPFDHPGLSALREQYKLDEVVKDAKTEWELMTRLAVWSSGLWERGHLKDVYPAWDAREILKPHADGKPIGGFCQQYNLVFLQACESFGIPGRAVSISQGIGPYKIKGGGHEVVELWSNQFQKWVYLDGNMAWYAMDVKREVPLSLWELRRRQLAMLSHQPTPAIRVVELKDGPKHWTGLDQWPPFAELRLIPRSNFLAKRSPLPLNQGMRGWFWTGHVVWTDDASPAKPLYGNRVTNSRNWNWSLNQVHLIITAGETPGELQIDFDTQTPGFDTFLVAVDNGNPKPAATGFRWKLHAGKNHLKVWPRNIQAREGIPSEVVLDFNP